MIEDIDLFRTFPTKFQSMDHSEIGKGLKTQKPAVKRV